MTLGYLTRECQTSHHNTFMTLYDVVPVPKAFWHFLNESCSVTLSFLCSKLTNPVLSNLGSEVICSENLSYINKEKGTLLGNEDRVKCRWHCYLYLFNSLVINVHILFIKKLSKEVFAPSSLGKSWIMHWLH